MYARINLGIGIHIETLADLDQALEHHRSQLRAWKTKRPEADELEIAESNIINIEKLVSKFDADNSRLLLEVEELKNSLNDLKDLLKKETAQREKLEIDFLEFKNSAEADKNASRHEREKLEIDFQKFKNSAEADKNASRHEREKLEIDFHEFKNSAEADKNASRHEREKLEIDFLEFKNSAEADKNASRHESEKQKSIIRAFDLIRMYRYYVADKIVGGNWGRFCAAYTLFEDEVSDKIKSQSDFDTFLKPFDDQLVNGLTISLIMKVSNERHTIAHADIRSVRDQKAFLEECSTVDFVDSKSNLIASKILPELKKCSLKRIN